LRDLFAPKGDWGREKIRVRRRGGGEEERSCFCYYG